MSDPDVLPVFDLVWGSHFGTYELRLPWALTWSPGLLRLYGITKAPTSPDMLIALVHPDDRDRVEAEGASYLASAPEGYSHTFRIVRPDGSVRIVLDRGAIERDDTGAALVFRGVNVDITDDANLNYSAERRLKASEERYRKLFEAIDEGFCIIEVDLDASGGRVDYRVVEANPAFYTQTGFPPSILGAWLREAAPALEEHWYETYGRVARTREPARFENHSELLGRWFEVYAFPLDHPDEHQVAILFSDISNRKQHEEQTQLLIGEVNHRSKNMLGVIQAIARSTITGDATEFVAQFSERVRALAATNDLLIRNGWTPVLLDELIRSQLKAFIEKSSNRIELAGPNLSLSPAASKALGMAFHELATNAAKYGAFSQNGGRIRVEWAVDSGDVRIIWQETGGPTVQTPQRQGFGWKVTKQMVESTTGGKVTMDYAPGGVVWTLDCPAAGLMT